LRSDATGSVRNFAITETAPRHWLPWGRLHESVRTGRPMAREALGMELFDPPDNRPSPAQSMDLNMMVILGGRERTEEEFERLFQATGFQLERVIPTHSPFSVIEATRVPTN
jgi:hypothetical protein